MISSTHITTGGAIGLAVGYAIPNPVIAIPAAFIVGVISHHAFDMIVHTDPGSFREGGDSGPAKKREMLFAFPDNLVGALIVLFVFFTREPSWPMLFGAAGANMPDVWHNVPYWSDFTRHKILPTYFKLHEKFHWTARGKEIPVGILTNATLIISALTYLFQATK